MQIPPNFTSLSVNEMGNFLTRLNGGEMDTFFRQVRQQQWSADSLTRLSEATAKVMTQDPGNVAIQGLFREVQHLVSTNSPLAPGLADAERALLLFMPKLSQYPSGSPERKLIQGLLDPEEKEENIEFYASEVEDLLSLLSTPVGVPPQNRFASILEAQTVIPSKLDIAFSGITGEEFAAFVSGGGSRFAFFAAAAARYPRFQEAFVRILQEAPTENNLNTALEHFPKSLDSLSGSRFEQSVRLSGSRSVIRWAMAHRPDLLSGFEALNDPIEKIECARLILEHQKEMEDLRVMNTESIIEFEICAADSNKFCEALLENKALLAFMRERFPDVLWPLVDRFSSPGKERLLAELGDFKQCIRGTTARRVIQWAVRTRKDLLSPSHIQHVSTPLFKLRVAALILENQKELTVQERAIIESEIIKALDFALMLEIYDYELLPILAKNFPRPIWDIVANETQSVVTRKLLLEALMEIVPDEYFLKLPVSVRRSLKFPDTSKFFAISVVDDPHVATKMFDKKEWLPDFEALYQLSPVTAWESVNVRQTDWTDDERDRLIPYLKQDIDDPKALENRESFYRQSIQSSPHFASQFNDQERSLLIKMPSLSEYRPSSPERNFVQAFFAGDQEGIARYASQIPDLLPLLTGTVRSDHYYEPEPFLSNELISPSALDLVLEGIPDNPDTQDIGFLAAAAARQPRFQAALVNALQTNMNQDNLALVALLNPDSLKHFSGDQFEKCVRENSSVPVIRWAFAHRNDLLSPSHFESVYHRPDALEYARLIFENNNTMSEVDLNRMKMRVVEAIGNASYANYLGDMVSKNTPLLVFLNNNFPEELWGRVADLEKVELLGDRAKISLNVPLLNLIINQNALKLLQDLMAKNEHLREDGELISIVVDCPRLPLAARMAFLTQCNPKAKMTLPMVVLRELATKEEHETFLHKILANNPRITSQLIREFPSRVVSAVDVNLLNEPGDLLNISAQVSIAAITPEKIKTAASQIDVEELLERSFEIMDDKGELRTWIIEDLLGALSLAPSGDATAAAIITLSISQIPGEVLAAFAQSTNGDKYIKKLFPHFSPGAARVVVPLLTKSQQAKILKKMGNLQHIGNFLACMPSSDARQHLRDLNETWKGYLYTPRNPEEKKRLDLQIRSFIEGITKNPEEIEELKPFLEALAAPPPVAKEITFDLQVRASIRELRGFPAFHALLASPEPISPEKVRSLLDGMPKAEELKPFVDALALVSGEKYRKPIPESFYCQILAGIMDDPVKIRGPDGKVGEGIADRESIIGLKRNPFTNAPFSESDLVPQTELKEEIENWKRENKL